MLKYLPLFVLAGALVPTGCAKSDPVADNAVAPNDNLLGDASASGLAAPGNSGAAEAAQQAAMPAATDGLGWTIEPSKRIALFGPPDTPAFSIQCRVQREGPKQLVFVRYLAPSAGGNATLGFTGNGQVASVPVAAVTNPDGIGGQWRTVIGIGDNARHVAETFGGPGTVNVSVSGLPSLVVPASAEPRRILADCLKG